MRRLLPVLCLAAATFGPAMAEPRTLGLEALGLSLSLGGEPLSGCQCPEPQPHHLDDQFPASAEGAIRFAALTRPTTRYKHGILGDQEEAGGLEVVLEDGGVREFTLADDSVFEDLTPRIADVTGDGADDVLAVRSYQRAGAALAVLGLVEAELKIVAETPPIGTPNRWLNPIGAGDLDGDGSVEIAYIETPHIGGILKIVRFEEGGLRLLGAWPGYSNHRIGSRNQLLGGVMDLDGDGSAEIVVPDQSHRVLHILRFDGEGIARLARVENPGRIESNFEIHQNTRGYRIRYALDDGTAVTLEGTRR